MGLTTNQKDHIEKHHGTDYFETAVITVINQFLYHGGKRILHERHHANFDKAWAGSYQAGNPFHGLKESVDKVISNKVIAVDKYMGEPLHTAYSWVEGQAMAALHELESRLRATKLS